MYVLYLYSKVTNQLTTHYSFVVLYMQNLSAPHNHQLTLSFLPQSYHKLLSAILWVVPQHPFLCVTGLYICFCCLQQNTRFDLWHVSKVCCTYMYFLYLTCIHSWSPSTMIYLTSFYELCNHKLKGWIRIKTNSLAEDK